MTDWVVQRWARYGHERLYAETPGGTKLGYLDLKTWRYHSDDLSNMPLLAKAIGDHFATAGVPDRPDAPPVPAPTPVPASAPAPVPSAESDVAGVVVQAAPMVEEQPVPEVPAAIPGPASDVWVDISDVRAGSAAREQALAARAAQGWFKNLLARALDVKTEERAWRIGAQGEEAVAAQIAKLGPEWRVLHAVSVGKRGSDIDHVLIGPAGVFTVNAKHHPDKSVWVGGDTVMIDGYRVPYIRNSRHEAARASRLLTEHAGFPVEAIGVVAVVGAHKGLTIKKQPEDGAVVVVPRKLLSQYLRKLSPRLQPREIDAIYEVARRSTTWQ